MTYAATKEDIAGLDLIGHRQDDGSITLGSGVNLPAFPEEVEIAGATFTLEDVRENDGPWRETAAPDHPGLRICWGVYV